MNNMLTQIDDDSLDLVSGGLELSVGPGALGHVVDGIVGAVKTAADIGGEVANGLIGLLPTVTISVTHGE